MKSPYIHAVVEPDNIILASLRKIDEKVDRLLDAVHDLQGRVTAVEHGLARVADGLASANGRIDRLEIRLDRIERRLELQDVG